MENLDTLRKLATVASNVRDIAFDTKIYQFKVAQPVTFYLDAEQSAVTLARWSQPEVMVRAQLQAGFGWRVITEQDEAGVYIIAKRRALVGNLSRAQFQVRVPHDTYCIMKLQNGALLLDGINGTVDVPPLQSDNRAIQITS